MCSMDQRNEVAGDGADRTTITGTLVEHRDTAASFALHINFEDDERPRYLDDTSAAHNDEAWLQDARESCSTRAQDGQ